jgi:membrane-bound lytic murein transglycosylase D
MERLKRLPTIMEMPYNEVVHKFIDRYAGRLRHSVGYMLGACNFYIPIFEEALEAYGLPLELKYLPIIESALNPNAVSRVGATGLWQFMLATGKQYGLEVNTLVDERRDPIKASYAAAHCLSDLYKIFGDWSLVIASYNCGPGNINKAIHRAGGKRDYWEIYPYLPRETRGYVPAFIAANYIMTYYSDHNICQMQTRLPGKTDTVVVNRNVHLSQIAAVLDLDLDMLFAESAKRQQSVDQINATVMRTVRRDLRLKLVRKWARLVGGCFGIPLALVIYVYVLNEAMSLSSMQTPLQIVCFALPLVTIAVLFARYLKKFRLDM